MNHGLLVCRFQNKTPVIAQYLLLLVALVLLEVEMNSCQSQLVLILTGHRYGFQITRQRWRRSGLPKSTAIFWAMESRVWWRRSGLPKSTAIFWAMESGVWFWFVQRDWEKWISLWTFLLNFRIILNDLLQKQIICKALLFYGKVI
jgi:hypothetical protein